MYIWKHDGVKINNFSALGGHSGGAMAGIAVGVIAAVVIVLAAIALVRRRKRNQQLFDE